MRPAFLQSSKTLTEQLFSFLGADSYMARILQNVQTYGYRVDYTYRPQPARGLYVPETALMERIKDLHHFQPQTPARFKISRWQSFTLMAHNFAHELVHFDQDMNGLFFTPLLIKNHPPVVPDEDSYIALYLLCEAMADTIATSTIARLSGYDFDGKSFLEHWHKSPTQRYYMNRARTLYHQNLNLYKNQTQTDQIKTISVSWSTIEPFIPSKDLKMNLKTLYMPYTPDSNVKQHFQHGAPPYLWAHSIKV